MSHLEVTATLQTIEPTRLTPSERLLRDVLNASVAGDVGISDVIVIWTDEDGRQWMRSAVNEAQETET